MPILHDTFTSYANLPGYPGETGKNTVGGVDVPKKKRWHGSHKIFKKYKTYLRRNLKAGFKPLDLKKFLRRLENDRNLEKMNKVLGFFDQLLKYETEHRELNAGAEYIPFYHSLLNRVTKFYDIVKEKEMSLYKNESDKLFSINFI